jgi:hypothetical protein
MAASVQSISPEYCHFDSAVATLPKSRARRLLSARLLNSYLNVGATTIATTQLSLGVRRKVHSRAQVSTHGHRRGCSYLRLFSSDVPFGSSEHYGRVVAGIGPVGIRQYATLPSA